MPIRPLPPLLIEKLRVLVATEIRGAKRKGRESRVHSTVGKMRNVDSRRRELTGFPIDATENKGRRVRQLAIRRRFPEIRRIVIKRIHGAKARHTIQEIINRVQVHNKRFSPKLYVLLEPVAHDIGANLVAMMKVNRPTIKDVLDKTLLGQKFFVFGKRMGLTLNDLRAAGLELWEKSGFAPRNVLVVGAKEGKFEFLPLIDLW